MTLVPAGTSFHGVAADMEKGVDARTMSAETFENCGNVRYLEDYLLLLWKETLYIVKNIKYLAKL